MMLLATTVTSVMSETYDNVFSRNLKMKLEYWNLKLRTSHATSNDVKTRSWLLCCRTASVRMSHVFFRKTKIKKKNTFNSTDPTYASPKTRPAPGEEHEYMDLSDTAGQPNRTADSEQRKQEEGV